MTKVSELVSQNVASAIINFNTWGGFDVNWLKGKIINFMGDSLTIGGSPLGIMSRPFPLIVGEILGCTTNNYGIGGSKLSGTDGMCERVLNMDLTADVNVIQGGCNDWDQHIPLGKITDTTNATVYGALDLLCVNVINNYPNTINYFILPPKSSVNVGNILYNLKDLNDAIVDIANKYNFIVIDMYYGAPNLSPFIDILKTRWQTDGTHFNQAYAELFFAPKIARALLSGTSNYISREHSTIDLGDYKISVNMPVTGALAFVPLTGLVENISSKSVLLVNDTLKILEGGIYDIYFSMQTLANWSGTASISIVINGVGLCGATNTFTTARADGASYLQCQRKVKLVKDDIVTFIVLSTTNTSVDKNPSSTFIQIKKI
jgi:lysophospholipase L1-like esterase